MKDLKSLTCPICKKEKSLKLDSVTMSVKCRNCGVIKEESLALPAKVKQTRKIAPPNTYPPIPIGTNHTDIVRDFVIDAENGRIPSGSIFCPKDAVPDDPIFKKAEGTPTELAAQFSAYLQGNNKAQFSLYEHQKRFANRRRYRRDIANKNADCDYVKWPFND